VYDIFVQKGNINFKKHYELEASLIILSSFDGVMIKLLYTSMTISVDRVMIKLL